MTLKNLQSCQQLVTGFVLGAVLVGGVAWAWVARRDLPAVSSALDAGRFTLTSPAASTFVRFDSATGEIVVYVVAGGTPGAYRLSDFPIIGRDPASFPSSTAGKPHP